MPRISVMTLDRARRVPPPAGCSGLAGALAWFDGAKDPLHLHLHEIAPGEVLRLEGGDTDRLAYVWSGGVMAGGCALAAGSSLVVGHGAALAIAGGAGPSRLLTFAAAQPAAARGEGGRVHLLPAERVARSEALPGSGGVSGGLHFNSGLPGCEIWLHENHFPGMGALSPEDQAKGIHSHSEDEIIFVTAGEIRLGNRLHGPGTALAIAADTLYSFTAGPAGLSFVNFRPATPGDIRFASGAAISETGYWRERVSQPVYLEPA